MCTLCAFRQSANLLRSLRALSLSLRVGSVGGKLKTCFFFLKSSWKYRFRSVTVRRAVPRGVAQSQRAVGCDPLRPEDRGTFLLQPPLRWPRVFQTVINFPVNTPASRGVQKPVEHVTIDDGTSILHFPRSFQSMMWPVIKWCHVSMKQSISRKVLGRVTTCNSWRGDWRFNEITNEFLNIDWVIDEHTPRNELAQIWLSGWNTARGVSIQTSIL